MSELRKYNADALFFFPLIEDGDADFVTDYTPAAGDTKVFTDKLISTNPTALILGFDSLSELPAQGAQLDENGAGTAEGVVAFTVITSGTVGGGDAAGFFFMRSVTGQAWSNNDQIDINGGTANIATADSTTHDLAATAGLIAILGNGQFASCLSPTEMTCAQGTIFIVDSATKACEDQAIRFHTYGNSAALHAQDLDQTLEAGADAALVTRKLDHLVAVAESDDPVNDSILAKMASTDGDWSNFAEGTDALQAIRDRGDSAWVTATGFATASNLATLTDAFILTSATIETVTSQTALIIPATADATDDDAYNGAIAVLIDGSDPNQKSFRLVTDYDAGTRTVTIQAAADFTVTTSDTITILASVAGLVWDEKLLGSNHNIANSAGRRLRQAQEAGGYTLGAVYLDTVNGTAGTTNFENGVDSQQVDSIADANTIATSVGLTKFFLAPNSSITFAATQDGQVFFGALWTLALGGQSVNNTHIVGAEVTGICTGTPHMDHCHLGTSSYAAGEFSECGLEDTITLTGAANYSFIDCYHEEEGGPSTIDFGSAVGTSEVHIHGWKGNLLIRNMDTGDILHFSSAEGRLEFDSTNTAGTKNLSGTFLLVDNSTGMTTNDLGEVLTKLPTALSSGNMKSDVLAISTDATAADRLEALMDGTLVFQVNAGTPDTTTMVVDGDVDDATDDHYIGRLITGLTGANAGQQTAVTDWNGTSKLLTFDALTGASADDDFWVMT